MKRVGHRVALRSSLLLAATLLLLVVALPSIQAESAALREPWARGSSDAGLLGNATTTDRATPVQAPAMHGVTGIVAGFHGSQAIAQSLEPNAGPAPAAAAIVPPAVPIVSSGYDPNAIEKLGVRYLHFVGGAANHGVYLGVNPDAAGRSASYVPLWSTDEAAPNDVTLTYDADADMLTSVLAVPGQADITTSYPAAGVLPSQGTLDYVHIQVVQRQAGTGVSLNNVTINGIVVGDFAGAGWTHWNVTGLDLSDGFVIAGDIYLTGAQPQRETNKVQINVGSASRPSDAQLCDLNGDHVVDIADVGLVGLHWGEQGVPGWIPEDINKDGVIDIADVGFIGLNWQKTW